MRSSGETPVALGDLARGVARLAAHRALGGRRTAGARRGWRARSSSSVDALGLELLEQLQRGRARGALEPVEQPFGGEVDAHSPLA